MSEEEIRRSGLGTKKKNESLKFSFAIELSTPFKRTKYFVNFISIGLAI